jgi:hypothetical protein
MGSHPRIQLGFSNVKPIVYSPANQPFLNHKSRIILVQNSGINLAVTWQMLGGPECGLGSIADLQFT